MRIVCSSCSAAYDVPDSLITPGRIVRCARCGSEWAPVQAGTATQRPAPGKATPPALVEQAIISALRVPAADSSLATVPPRQLSAMERLAAHPAWPVSRVRLRLAWAASLALIVFLGWAAYAWRAQIVEAWPPSARMYAALGMKTDANRTP
jgi:predicted Zn finger-like uncharacterized protein